MCDRNSTESLGHLLPRLDNAKNKHIYRNLGYLFLIPQVDSKFHGKNTYNIVQKKKKKDLIQVNDTSIRIQDEYKQSYSKL